MTLIKKQQEIEVMHKAGKVLGQVLQETLEKVKPGVTEIELDSYAEKRIGQLGGFPGFKKVEGYHHAVCVATNDVVVHGIPKKRVLQEGDIIGIDCGVFMDGFHTDMAETVVVGKTKNKEIYKFLESGKEAMYAGMRQAKAGNHVGDISKAIQDIVERRDGYSVTRSLIGHGVGRELHEDPQVPGYLSGKIERTPLLVPGMTIAVEVIYNMGGKDVVYEGTDDWTIVTEDGSLSAVFERTIEITAEEPRLITPFPGETL